MSVAVRVERCLALLSRAIVGMVIFASIAINFANIVGRYAFRAPLLWAEEILVFLMVWSVFIGAVLVTLEGRHIRMDLLSVKLPSPAREIVNVVAALTFLAVCGFFAVQAWSVAWLMYASDQRSLAADVPVVYAHAALLAGFVAMFLAVLVRFSSYVRNSFGSEKDAVTKQVTETFGTFEGGK
jgi:TRAP-type C4-dicarboxylate transport system permease small subunit